MKKTVGQIPNFITATSPKGLRRSMLKVQLKLGYGVEFFDFEQLKNGKHICWYESNENINQFNVGEQLGSNSERDD